MVAHLVKRDVVGSYTITDPSADGAVVARSFCQLTALLVAGAVDRWPSPEPITGEWLLSIGFDSIRANEYIRRLQSPSSVYDVFVLVVPPARSDLWKVSIICGPRSMTVSWAEFRTQRDLLTHFPILREVA